MPSVRNAATTAWNVALIVRSLTLPPSKPLKRVSERNLTPGSSFSQEGLENYMTSLLKLSIQEAGPCAPSPSGLKPKIPQFWTFASKNVCSKLHNFVGDDRKCLIRTFKYYFIRTKHYHPSKLYF